MKNSLPKLPAAELSKNLRLKISPRKNKYTPLIIVISSDEDTRYLFKTMLELSGFRAADLGTTEEFSRICNPEKPDLIILDTPLSFLDGLINYCQLREFIEDDQIPITLLSGYSQEKYRDAALRLGANDYLVKPIDFDTFEEKLTGQLKRRTHGSAKSRKFDQKPHTSSHYLLMDAVL